MGVVTGILRILDIIFHHLILLKHDSIPDRLPLMQIV